MDTDTNIATTTEALKITSPTGEVTWLDDGQPGREARGKVIALHGRIRQVGRRYIVPSQTRGGDVGSYFVDLVDQQCTCPDYETRRVKCKHQHAVEWSLILERAVDSDGTVTETLTVKKKRKNTPRDWSAYHESRKHEKERVEQLLKALCDGIQQPPQKMGRPRKLLRDKVFAGVHKVYTTIAGERAQSDLQTCKKHGLVDEAVSTATMFRTLEDPSITPILKALVEESALPLKQLEEMHAQFSIDSTGFSTTMYGPRWFDEKYVEKSTKLWVKLHAMIGTRTHVITACDVTSAGDCPMLPPLLTATAKNFNVKEVSADKAYLAGYNVEAINAVGATPYIPFKINSTGDGPLLLRKMYAHFMVHSADFNNHYHRRSNVESVFWMVKSKLGASVRSKTPVAQTNELLAKCVLHNLCCIVNAIYESGITPEFWQDVPATSTTEAA